MFIDPTIQEPKVLFIGWTRLGDAILGNAMLDHIVREAPGAKVTVVTGPIPAGVYHAAPNVEQVYVVRKESYSRHWWHLWRAMWGTKWDYVIDLKSSALAYFLRAKHRHVFREPAKEVMKIQQMEQCFGLPPVLHAAVWPNDDDAAKANNLINGDGPFIALGATAANTFKAWPVENFIELAEQLLEEGGLFAGHKVLVFGAPGEETQTAPVVAALGERAIDLSGKLSPAESAAAMARAKIFIGNDSGLMHMACALDVPAVALFGPTKDWVYGPSIPASRTVRARPYDELIKGLEGQMQRSHLTEITVPMALAAVEDLARAQNLL